MKIGRIRGNDGSARLALALDETNVVDVREGEVIRRVRAGARREAAERVAAALYPGSLREALGSGPLLLDGLAAIRELVARGVEEALVPADRARFLPPTDPLVMRDFMSFETHIINSIRAMGNARDLTLARGRWSRTLRGPCGCGRVWFAVTARTWSGPFFLLVILQSCRQASAPVIES